MLKVAITGNIASGKSEVEKIVSQFYPVYDVDKIAHAILGNVDRKSLGEKVFSNPKALKELEEFIHPKVKQEIMNVFNGIETERNIAGLIAPSLNKNIIFISISSTCLINGKQTSHNCHFIITSRTTISRTIIISK